MADFYIFVKVRTGSKVFLIYFFYFLCMMPFLSLWILIRQNELGLGSQIKISSRKQGSCAAISLLAGIVFLLEVSVFGHEPCNNNSVLYLAIQGSLFIVLFFVSVLAPFDYFLPWITYVDFGVWIWGSFAVFSVYPQFDASADPLSEHYCPPVPFYTAFSFLISSWAILLLAVCVIVTGLLVYCICILCCSPKETKNGLHEEEMENPVRSV